MTTINYNGMELTLDYAAQIANYSDGGAFFAKAHDDQGTAYSIRWVISSHHMIAEMIFPTVRTGSIQQK